MPSPLPPTISDATVTTMPAWLVTALGANKYCGYCTIADVQQEFLDVANMPVSANSSNVVAQSIVKAALELQSILDPVYTMPYAGTDTYVLGRLSEFNAKLAAALISALQFGSGTADQSVLAASLRAYVEAQLTSIIHGEERWEAPFHDAVSRAEMTAYPHSAVALVNPDPGSADPAQAKPIFTMSGLNYSSPVI